MRRALGPVAGQGPKPVPARLCGHPASQPVGVAGAAGQGRARPANHRLQNSLFAASIRIYSCAQHGRNHDHHRQPRSRVAQIVGHLEARLRRPRHSRHDNRHAGRRRGHRWKDTKRSGLADDQELCSPRQIPIGGLVNVRSGALNGLKSDIGPCPKSARSSHSGSPARRRPVTNCFDFT